MNILATQTCLFEGRIFTYPEFVKWRIEQRPQPEKVIISREQLRALRVSTAPLQLSCKADAETLDGVILEVVSKSYDPNPNL